MLEDTFTNTQAQLIKSLKEFSIFMVNEGTYFCSYACALHIRTLTELLKRIQSKFSSSLVKIHTRCATCPLKLGWYLELRPNNPSPGNSNLALTRTKTDFPAFASDISCYFTLGNKNPRALSIRPNIPVLISGFNGLEGLMSGTMALHAL